MEVSDKRSDVSGQVSLHSRDRQLASWELLTDNQLMLAICHANISGYLSLTSASTSLKDEHHNLAVFVLTEAKVCARFGKLT